MKSMTDERVRNESAPFDHPEILIPNGNADPILIPARDAFGNTPLPVAVSLNPVSSPTKQSSQPISGANSAGVTVHVNVNNGPDLPVNATSPTTWNITVTGLVEGDNTITATAIDNANVAKTVSATITLDSVPPVLNLNAVTTPTRLSVQTVSGTVEAGITPVVTVTPPATAGLVSVFAGTWSCQVTGLAAGDTTITVTATDLAGNVTGKTSVLTVIFPDGNLKASGSVDITDALKALRIAVGMVQPTPSDLLHGDVAPLANNVSAPDGRIDVADALLILRKAVGLSIF